MFGVLLALLALIQLSAVPGWNQAIEIQHNERVQDDMQLFTADVRSVAATGQPRTGVVELGIQYPPRPFLYNPPDPGGTVRTSDPEPFSVRNVDIVGVDNYWGPTSPEAGTVRGTTRQLQYRPNYNEYRAPPTTRYEHGVLYNEFDTPLFMARAGFLDGRRITLTAVNGSVDRTAGDTVSIPIEPESAPANPVTVRNRSAGPLEIRLPTTLSESAWERLLSDEYERNGGHIVGDEAGVTVVDDTLVVSLAPGVEYELRMARVSVGDRSHPTAPRYVTAVEGGETALRPSQGDRLTVEVRDRFNNPKPGTPVHFDATDGFVQPTSARTGVDGRVSVQYTAPADEGLETVTASIDADGDGDRTDPGEKTAIAVTVSNGTDTSDSFADVNPGPNSETVRVTSGTSISGGMEIDFDNDAPTPLTLTRVRVAYYYSDDTNPPPSTGTFSHGGESQSFSIPGAFVDVAGPTLAADGQPNETATVTLLDLKNNVKDDFVVIHTVWVDPTGTPRVTSYIVSAR